MNEDIQYTIIICDNVLVLFVGTAYPSEDSLSPGSIFLTRKNPFRYLVFAGNNS